jgi:hypothetical protein
VSPLTGMRIYQAPDGLAWAVDVKVPSHSSAMVVFKHPDGTRAHGDRYAWYNARRPEASDPRARLRGSDVLGGLSDAAVAALFRRSMPVHTDRPRYVVT